jgi:hypothetical protein
MSHRRLIHATRHATREDRNPQAGSLAENVCNRNDDNCQWCDEARDSCHGARRGAQCPVATITSVRTDYDQLCQLGTAFTPGFVGVEMVNGEVGADGDGSGIPSP